MGTRIATLIVAAMSPFLAVSMARSQTLTNGDWVYNVTSGLATITGYKGSGFTVAIPSVLGGYTVTSIGNGAFGSRSNINAVDIPTTITNIGSSAFSGCKNLSNIVIPGSVRHLGVSAFADCSILATVTIAHGLADIPAYAFAACLLTKVTIPASVTNIQSIAFQGTGGGTFLFLGNAPAGLLLGNFPNNFKPYRLPGSTGFPAYVGGNAIQVTSLYTQADLTNGLFTQAQYDANRTNGRADVTNNPAAYGLFTQSQYDLNRTNGRLDVIYFPASYDLYTSNSIMDLRMGGAMVQKQGNNAVITFQTQTTTDLVTQPFTNHGTPVTNTVAMPENKGFLRIQAK